MTRPLRTLRRARLAPLLLPVLLLPACRPPAASGAPAPRPRPAPAPAADATGASADADLAYLHTRMLMVPVAGVSPERVPDSFHAPRSGDRVHRAVDIMAPRGTPVLSADDGRVLRVSRNRLGGLTVYAVDPSERFVYYYAHLDRYRDGLRAGMPLRQGDVIGYVGTTGNAPPNAPHLHFQVMRYRASRYWDGDPVDPRPYFVFSGLVRDSAATVLGQ